MGLMENVRIALRSVRSNLLRAILTLLIIAIGIMSLVAILTAVDSVAATISKDFSSIGANSFDIKRSGDGGFGGRRRGRNSKRGPYFTYRQAADFKEKYTFPSTVSLSFRGTGLGTVKYKGEDSNPNIDIMGADENYLTLEGYEIEQGRYFTTTEANSGRNICVLGQDIVKSLFDGKTGKALGEIVNVGNLKYKIVGVLAAKGSGFDGGSDRIVIIPLFTAKSVYGIKNRSYNIKVSTKEAQDMDAAIAAATPVLRNIRRLKVGEENDFETTKSDGLLDVLAEQQGYLRAAAIIIGIITLLGASVGLMNIMLVSVTERTREIGVRKALGATSRNILTQFLIEAIVICQMGGLVGVFLGIVAGNAVASAAEGTFIIPWVWVIISLIICLVVGLASGIYPALKASKLDPIEALRYE
jgi:putative ABC transport system permease protein